MTILILVGMAVLVGVLLLYVFELGRSRRLLLKAGNARKALRGSEELFRSIMQNVHAFILLIDRDFVVTRTNYYDITKARQPEGRLARVGDYCVVTMHCLPKAVAEHMNFAAVVLSERRLRKHFVLKVASRI